MRFNRRTLLQSGVAAGIAAAGPPHAQVETGYIAESAFQWCEFTLDGGTRGATIDLVVAGADGRDWRLAALAILKPGL